MMDTDALFAKLDKQGYAVTLDKVEMGLYSSRKESMARLWLKRNKPIEPSIPNVLVIVAPKSKMLKWIFSKLGIGKDTTTLIEHDE